MTYHVTVTPHTKRIESKSADTKYDIKRAVPPTGHRDEA